MNRTANPIFYGMRIERRLDDDYFNFVTRLAKNQQKQRMIVFGEHLLNVSRFWLSVDFTCTPEKMIHSPYLNVQIEKRIDDRMLQCIVDTLGSSITRPMQLCVEPSQLMPESAMENIEFTQIILEEALIAEGSEDKKEREYASNILPLRSQGNFLLCSIVLGNTICNTLVTLLINDMCESINDYFVYIVLSLVIPTTIITLLGEIVPQAICARHALCIGSRTRYLTIFFMVFSAPISYPFSLILDWLLGKEGRDVYDRKTLRVLITMQRDLTKEKLSNQMDGETTDLVLAAFDLPEKIVKSVMTPIDKIFMLSDQSVIDKMLLKAIAAKGRTRIPIYSGSDRNTIMAILNMKDLLPFCKTTFLKVGTIVQLWKRSNQFRFIIDSMPVLQLLIEMRTGIHIAMVVTYDEQKRDYIVQGLVTLEDLVEEVVGEIFDEQDVRIRRAGQVSRNWRRTHMYT